MGPCLSSSAAPLGTHAYSPAQTSKVLMPSGALAEFSSLAVTASLVLPPGCFLCDSDELEIDLPAPAIPPDRLLLPGRLYFALPERMRGAPLQGSFMAELAVTASAALEEAAAGKGIKESSKTNTKNKRPVTVYGDQGNRWWGGCLLSSFSPKKKNKSLTVELDATNLHDVPPATIAMQKKSTPAPRLQRKGSIRERLVRRLSGRSRLTPIDEVTE